METSQRGFAGQQGDEMAATNLGKLPLCLPLPSERVCVATVKLA